MQSCYSQVEEVYFTLVGKLEEPESLRRKKSNLTLRKIKKLTKKRFLPNNYKQDSLKQHGMNVEEYIRKFQQLFMRCTILEMQVQIIARFLGGMSRAITDLIEFQPY